MGESPVSLVVSQMTKPLSHQWISQGMTHTGKVRQINQDAFLNLPEQQLWLVADGMGGHQEGEVASAAIVESLQDYSATKTLGTSVKKVYRKLAGVNQDLLATASLGNSNDIIGSTVAILLAQGRHGVCFWSGDSRIYLFRNSQLNQLTRDHNHEEVYLAEGLTPEQVMSNPYTQALTHAVGVDHQLFTETLLLEIKQNDIFLLCSDGLNKEVTDLEIEDRLKMPFSVDENVHQLVELSLARGARDNVTVIVAKNETKAI